MVIALSALVMTGVNLSAQGNQIAGPELVALGGRVGVELDGGEQTAVVVQVPL